MIEILFVLVETLKVFDIGFKKKKSSGSVKHAHAKNPEKKCKPSHVN